MIVIFYHFRHNSFSSFFRLMVLYNKLSETSYKRNCPGIQPGQTFFLLYFILFSSEYYRIPPLLILLPVTASVCYLLFLPSRNCRKSSIDFAAAACLKYSFKTSGSFSSETASLISSGTSPRYDSNSRIDEICP